MKYASDEVLTSTSQSDEERVDIPYGQDGKREKQRGNEKNKKKSHGNEIRKVKEIKKRGKRKTQRHHYPCSNNSDRSSMSSPSNNNERSKNEQRVKIERFYEI